MYQVLRTPVEIKRACLRFAFFQAGQEYPGRKTLPVEFRPPHRTCSGISAQDYDQINRGQLRRTHCEKRARLDKKNTSGHQKQCGKCRDDPPQSENTYASSPLCSFMTCRISCSYKNDLPYSFISKVSIVARSVPPFFRSSKIFASTKNRYQKPWRKCHTKPSLPSRNPALMM